MGKRRNTAKTGDKALYNSRKQQLQRHTDQEGRSKNRDRDDPMYNEIDRFHNDRDGDFIRLGDDGDDESDVDDDVGALIGNREAVLDLGVGGDSSDDDDDDDDDDDAEYYSEDDERKKKGSDDSSNEGEIDDDDDDDDDDNDNIEQDPRRWGKKKSLYYHGDTADLEIGQEEEDAFLEEEAAKEIQASRFEEMDEDDFVLSDDDDNNNKGMEAKSTENERKGTYEHLSTVRDPMKLPEKAARKLLQKCYPELLPMVSYFSDIVKDLKDRTQVATSALLDGAGTAESVGATIRGQEYLLTKSLMQKSIALNVVMYLLLRSASVGEDDEDASANIQAHPVMEQLKKFNSILQKFEKDVHNKTEGIDDQLENLVKAAALMGEVGNVTSDDESDGSSDEKSDEEEQNDGAEEEDLPKESSNSDEEEETVDEGISRGRDKQQDFQRTLNEARFGLRSLEAKEPSEEVRKRRIWDMDDFGDLEEERSTSASRLLASTVNTIEQRSQVASRKRRPAPLADTLDDLDEHDDQLAQGIKMMEQEMGKLDDDIDDDEKDYTGEEEMTDPDHDDETSDFYNVIAQRSKAKKSFKKSLYQVAPKFPRADGEVDGERAISKTILKNRGLVAHKAKINRNPRVKKRMQYDKALKKRKGAVREVRQDEGHKYGGEGTGIKSGISRSRKLTMK